jgi:hypothetical protein
MNKKAKERLNDLEVIIQSEPPSREVRVERGKKTLEVKSGIRGGHMGNIELGCSY